MPSKSHLRDTIIFGFDSAWVDNPKTPGAICALGFNHHGACQFLQPKLVNFDSAEQFIIAAKQDYALGILAIDQPTLVPNLTGSRPADRAAAALMSYIGGGVQPANRQKDTMFGDDAPIWRFLTALNAIQDPLATRSARVGLYAMEVFPALALPTLYPPFAARLGAPKYNPANRKKFKYSDWQAVTKIIADTARNYRLSALERWAMHAHSIPTPKKADQDRLDAVICALIGYIWQAGAPGSATMIGDLETGYIIAPVSDLTQDRLKMAAIRQNTAFTVNG